MALLEKLFSKAKEKWRERDTERKKANSSTGNSACCQCVSGCSEVKWNVYFGRSSGKLINGQIMRRIMEYNFSLSLSVVNATNLAAISFDGRIMANLLAPSICLKHSGGSSIWPRVCTTRNVSCYWTAIGASDGWERRSMGSHSPAGMETITMDNSWFSAPSVEWSNTDASQSGSHLIYFLFSGPLHPQYILFEGQITLNCSSILINVHLTSLKSNAISATF